MPVYNEGEAVVPVLRALEAAVTTSHETLVVYDFDEDSTVPVIAGSRLNALMSRVAGLTLHWFGGVPVHDATSNFRLYRRSYLETVTIESRAGFELALELTVKATLAGRRVAEVPTIWRDRTSGT